MDFYKYLTNFKGWGKFNFIDDERLALLEAGLGGGREEAGGGGWRSRSAIMSAL